MTERTRTVVSVRKFVRRHLHAKHTEDALWSWQQTADQQEMELASLRAVRDHGQMVVDSFDRAPTEGCVRDVIGLAESLRRYRQMRDGMPKPKPLFDQGQGVMPK